MDNISAMAQQRQQEAEMRRRGNQAGSLRRRGGAWYVQYSRHVRDAQGNVSYQRTQQRIGDAEGAEKISRKEAIAAMRRLVDQANAPAALPKGISTLEQFREVFTEHHYPKVRTATRRLYDSLLDNHIMPSLGAMTVGEMRTIHIQMMLDGKAEHLSPQTVTHLRNVLSAMFRCARRLGLIEGILPTEDVLLPEMRRREPRALTLHEVKALSSALSEPYCHLVDLIAYTGLRRAEAAGLLWPRVNLSDEARIQERELVPANSIIVREQWADGLAPVKTRASRRTIALPAVARRALMIQQEVSRGPGFVFAARSGNPIDMHNAFNRHLRPAAKRLGFGDVGWHTLRHTFATLATLAGVSSDDKRHLMGHTSTAMSEHYTHADRGAAGRLLDLLQ